jgi:hypothetical protein
VTNKETRTASKGFIDVIVSIGSLLHFYHTRAFGMANRIMWFTMSPV